VRLLFAGTPGAAVPALEAVLASGHELVAVLTRPDAPSGRGRTILAAPVATLAAEAGVEVLKPSSPRDPVFLDRLTELAPDCCPVVAYGGLIPAAALAVPPKGWVNLHFSLLPAWRGAAPVQHAILHGDEVTGASTFLLDQGLDTGPVLGIVTEQVRPTDTSGDLLARLALSGAQLLVATLDGIESGAIRPQPQPPDGVSLAPKLTADDARVDWQAPALRVDRLLRACTPAPGPWTSLRGERVKLGPLRAGTEVADLAPGEIAFGRDSVGVGTGSTGVVLGEVQPQGRRPMAAADWARGLRLSPGERFDR
jgi:methionyl-tRNA formyltransferase